MGFVYTVTVENNGSATFKKMETDADGFQKKMKAVDTTVNIVNKSLGMLKTAGAAALGNLAMAAVGNLKDLAKEMVDSYDSAAKLSNNVGIAADSIIGLRHAAEHSGIGAEALDKNLVKLSKTISEAANGSKGAAETFNKLGIDIKNNDGSVKDSEEVLMKLADKFKDLPAGAQRATLAMEVFGKSGASMVTMLQDGSGALKKMSDDGKLAAGDIDSIAKTMQDLKDAGTDAKAAMQGFIATLADNGAMTLAIESVKNLSKAFLEWRKASAVEKEQEKSKEMKELADATSKYYGNLEVLGKLQEKLKQEDQGTAAYKKIADDIKRAEKEVVKLGETVNKLNGTKIEMSFLGNVKKVDATAALKSELEGIRKVYSSLNADAKAEADIRIFQIQSDIKYEKEKANAIEETKKAKQAAALALLDDGKKSEEAAKKMAQQYEAESKRLKDWLENYEKAKRTERDIAHDSYQEQLKNFDDMEKRKLIDQIDSQTQRILAGESYRAKIKELDDRDRDEALKAEHEKAMAAIEAARLVEEAARAREERMRDLRETAAQRDDERIFLQKERINARYDEEVAKAQESAETIEAIEAARNAELARQDEALKQLRLANAQQYVDSIANVAEAAVVLGKAGGEAQKGVAISQAMINTGLAASKAATAAPWPLNMALVAGAIAQGMTQVATIKAQKFARGGMIPGSNTLIMANEEGREAILNTRAVRAIGGEAGVNALNRGTSNTYDNRSTSTVNINLNTAILTQQAFRNEIEPVLRNAERRR